MITMPISNKYVNIFNKIKSAWCGFYGGILFIFENSRKRYQYILIGEKHYTTQKSTILQYRIIGKRHIFEMTAKDMCNTKEMIGRFHPLDVRIISFIAGVEQILEIENNKINLDFCKLKSEIFKNPI